MLFALGAYGNMRDFDWAKVRRLAFVCKGNICRSPYACAKARKFGVRSSSYGLDAVDGSPADPVALRNAIARTVDLSVHRSMRMNETHIEDGDLIMVFEPVQLAEVRRRLGDRMPAGLLGIWSRENWPHIQDPYGLSDRYFQRCFSVIDASVAGLVQCMMRGGAPAIDNECREISSDNIRRRRNSDRTLL